jgi:hypothetical protein
MRSIHDRCGMASAERRRSGGSEVNTRKGKERNGELFFCFVSSEELAHPLFISIWRLHSPPMVGCGLGMSDEKNSLCRMKLIYWGTGRDFAAKAP